MKKGKDGDPLSAVYLVYKPFFVKFNNKQSGVSALKRQDVTKEYLLQFILSDSNIHQGFHGDEQ